MNSDYFLSRRSCRNFKDQEIDSETLTEIIRRSSKAPTCGNMQLYSVIVTRKKDTCKKLSEFHFNQPASSTAPVILTICADFNRFTKWCELNSADAGYDNFHSFITAMTDAIIFAQQIVTVAEMQGYGSCYLGTVTYNAKEISDLLGLPELVVPVASVALGVIDREGEETHRLEPEVILHLEKYRKDSDEKIKEDYKIYDEDPINIKFIKENHKENLAQVFAEIRYPRSTNEKNSEMFLTLLKEKGFMK